jgi:hypothetical protein
MRLRLLAACVLLASLELANAQSTCVDIKRTYKCQRKIARRGVSKCQKVRFGNKCRMSSLLGPMTLLA